LSCHGNGQGLVIVIAIIIAIGIGILSVAMLALAWHQHLSVMEVATALTMEFPLRRRQNVLNFLHEHEGNLDVGVGLQLYRLAWAKGSEVAALTWLSSLLVQEFMCQLCEETLATSLPVERRLGEVKQWETAKRTNIATASRNMLVVRFAKLREKLAGMHAAALRKLRKAEKTTRTALAWQTDPSKCRVGTRTRWTQSNQGAPMAKFVHTPQKLRTACQAKSVHTPQKKKLRTPRPTPEKQSAGGGQDLAARREALLATAKAECQSIVSMCDLPITRPQWAAWLDDNIGEFHERMKTAPQRRSALNTRLRARRDLPEPLKRLHPRSGAKAECSTQWAKNLAGRSGWHGLETNTKRMMMMLMCNGGVTYYIDLEPNRVEPGVLSYALTCDFDLETSLALQTRTPSLHLGRTASGAERFYKSWGGQPLICLRHESLPFDLQQRQQQQQRAWRGGSHTPDPGSKLVSRVLGLEGGEPTRRWPPNHVRGVAHSEAQR